MKEKTLRNIAIICSFFGLLLLYLISTNLELKITEIREVNINDIGKNVKVCGKIENKFSSKDGHTFFELIDETGKIKVVVFSNTVKNLNKSNIDVSQLKEKSKICVLGEVNEYKNELEIIGKKLEYTENVS